VPYLAGLGLSNGVRQQAEASIRHGADLYVTATDFGRNAPVPITMIDDIQKVEGVKAVVPRIVGELTIGANHEPAVVVGMPPETYPDAISCVEGRLPQTKPLNELVMGAQLARRLKLTVGSMIPPFYHNDEGDFLSEVVGIFKSDVSLWESNLIFATFETASRLFNQRGMATDLLVYCRPGYQPSVADAIQNGVSFVPRPGAKQVRLRVTAREDLEALLPQGLLHREGIFNLHFLLAFVVGILVVLVTSGIGLAGARREIAILKATGWQTDEILLRNGVESLLLSLAGASVSVVLAFIWLRAFNGYFIASIFLAGVGAAPDFPVPFILTPVPVLLTFLISFVVVMSGTLYSSWRGATAAPMTAMR